MHICSTALCMGLDVIVDKETCVSADTRKRFIGLAHALDIPVDAVSFKFEDAKTHAIRRCSSDNRGFSYNTWLKTAKKLNAYYDIPSYNEGFRTIYRYDFKSGILSEQFKQKESNV